MKKIKSLFLLMAIIATMGVTSSCKDHDTYNDLNSEIQDVKDDNQTLKEALTSQQDSLKDALSKLEEDFGNLDITSGCNCLERIDSIVDVIAGLSTGTIEDMQAADSVMNDAIQSAIADIESMQAADSVINDTITSIKQKLAQMQNYIDDIDLDGKVDTAVFNSAIRDLKATVASMGDRIATLEQTAASKESLQNAIDSLGTIIDGKASVAALHTVDSLLGVTIGRLDNFDGQNKTIEQVISTIEGNINILNDSIGKFSVEIARLTGTVSADSAWIERMKQLYGDDLENLVGANIDTTGMHNEIVALTDRVAALEENYQGIITNETLADTLRNIRAEMAAKDTELADSINNIRTDLNSLADRVATLESTVGEMQETLTSLEGRMTAVENELAKLITGITVNGAINDVTGYGAMPLSIRTNILATWYGTATQAVKFPSNDIEAYNGVRVKIANNNTLVTRDGEEGNAGKIYLTLNPFNKDFSGVIPKLVNSQSKESAVTLGAIKYSEDVLSFGYTRAGSDNGFYEAPATLSASDISSVKPNISKSDIKQIAKDVLTPRNGINLANVFTKIYQNMQNVLPALAVKVEAGDKSTAAISQYEIAATAVPALSYDFLRDYTLTRRPHINLGLPSEIELNIKVDSINISVNEDGTNSIIVTYEVPDGFDLDLDIEVDSLTNDATGTGTVEISKYRTDTIAIDLDSFVSSVNGEVNSKLTSVFDKVNEEINNQFGSLLERGNELLDKVNGLLDRAYNFVDNINDKLQPILVFEGSDKAYHLLSEMVYGPSTFKMSSSTGAIELYPTSFSAELLAPAYKKYVAVTNVYTDNTGNTEAADKAEIMEYANNSATMNTVLDGYVRTVAVPVKDSFKGKVLEITYSAVDYSGVVVTNKYYVTIQ